MTTPLFFETIKILDGRIYNFDLHAERMRRTMLRFFPDRPAPSISPPLVPNSYRDGLYRCRIEYAAEVIGISFSLYERRAIRSLALVDGDGLDYCWKNADRSALLRLVDDCGCDDVLIVRGGKIADTSFSNVVFENGDGFFTPSTPLLPGTKRAELLGNGRIIERDIRPDDFGLYDRIILINALNDIEDGPSLDVDLIRSSSNSNAQKTR